MRKNRHVTSKGIETDRRFTLDLTCQDKSNMQVINVCITSKRRIGGLNSSVFLSWPFWKFFASSPWNSVKARMGRKFDDYPGFHPKTTPAQRYATQCNNKKNILFKSKSKFMVVLPPLINLQHPKRLIRKTLEQTNKPTTKKKSCKLLQRDRPLAIIKVQCLVNKQQLKRP